MEDETKFSWFINASEVELGGSSVLGGNDVMFYMIHGVAISLIIISLISSIAVIISITGRVWRNIRQKKETKRLEFADRFPLYLAIADTLWSISHLFDHLYLVTTQTFPSSQSASTFLSIYVWTFLGYQQLMHAGLAIYTYMRVVRGVELNFGRGEWKLQFLCLLLMSTSNVVFYFMDAFGPSGYWMIQNVRTPGGTVLGWYVTFSATFQALVTTLCYLQIKGVIEHQKRTLLKHGLADNYSTASECLSTFVIIALALYCPIAIISWACLMAMTFFGVIDPIISLIIVIISNSSGWGNAVGYWHNLKVKARGVRAKEEKVTMITSSTTGSRPASDSSAFNK